jgi:hypothetical protein
VEALTAMTSLAADTVARQFTYSDAPEEDVGDARRPAWRGRAALADLLELAARAVAPRGHTPVPRLP